jgi:hypothetical protein
MMPMKRVNEFVLLLGGFLPFVFPVIVERYGLFLLRKFFQHATSDEVSCKPTEPLEKRTSKMRDGV